jgi:hypothetical protein
VPLLPITCRAFPILSNSTENRGFSPAVLFFLLYEEHFNRGITVFGALMHESFMQQPQEPIQSEVLMTVYGAKVDDSKYSEIYAKVSSRLSISVFLFWMNWAFNQILFPVVKQASVALE